MHSAALVRRLRATDCNHPELAKSGKITPLSQNKWRTVQHWCERFATFFVLLLNFKFEIEKEVCSLWCRRVFAPQTEISFKNISNAKELEGATTKKPENIQTKREKETLGSQREKQSWKKHYTAVYARYCGIDSTHAINDHCSNTCL
jgi:hypothetical protein